VIFQDGAVAPQTSNASLMRRSTLALFIRERGYPIFAAPSGKSTLVP